MPVLKLTSRVRAAMPALAAAGSEKAKVELWRGANNLRI
jgi:hypothetical protein